MQLFSEIKSCQKCHLARSRQNVVVGEGNIHRGIVLVGEAPGAREDETGRPFVGDSGVLLEEILASIGLNRFDVYITNVVKCRPPDNRDPTREEITACSAHLWKQLRYIKPRLIVPIGRHALNFFLPKTKIGAFHGHAKHIGKGVVFSMYHPAVVLHNPKYRDVLFQDAQNLNIILKNMGKRNEV